MELILCKSVIRLDCSLKKFSSPKFIMSGFSSSPGLLLVLSPYKENKEEYFHLRNMNQRNQWQLCQWIGRNRKSKYRPLCIHWNKNRMQMTRANQNQNETNTRKIWYNLDSLKQDSVIFVYKMRVAQKCRLSEWKE